MDSRKYISGKKTSNRGSEKLALNLDFSRAHQIHSQKNLMILVLSFIFIFLSMNLVCAASDYRVAYIYKSKTDKNIIDLFSSLKLNVDLVKESSLPLDLSGYKFIFVGDENFAKDIPIDKYPSVIMNHYMPKKTGLVNNVGISQLVSNKPLFVSANGNSVQVYRDYKDNRGVSISYYFLDNYNMASSLKQYLGTYATSSGADFGSVSAFGSPGDTLLNGNTLGQNICFFGITKTDYWTSDAENFFKECVKYVFDYTVVIPDVINCTNDNVATKCGANVFSGIASCSGGNVFKNYITYKCNNPGEVSSYCSSSTSSKLFETCTLGCGDGKCNSPICTKDLDCDDGNFLTEDKCVNQGTSGSICIHNIYNNVTKIKLVSLVAIPGLNSVTLNFSAINEEGLIKGYLLSSDREKWTLVLSPATGYVFEGLNSNTAYVFYAKAVDVNSVNSDEMSIFVTTLNNNPVEQPAPASSGGGGGGGSYSGGFSYCSLSWECSEWGKCSGGKQTRTCSVPDGKCIPETSKPIESQSCVESAVVENKEASSSGNETEETTGTATGSNPITGASIAGILGKYSWVGVIVVLGIIGIGYWFLKKP